MPDNDKPPDLPPQLVEQLKGIKRYFNSLPETMKQQLRALPADHLLLKTGRELQQWMKGELERRNAKPPVAKKKTKPPKIILHLDEALDALAVARRDKPRLRTSLKAAAFFVMTFLAMNHSVVVNDSERRTIERRITKRDKSRH